MNKPLFRWIIGNVSNQGLQVFKEAIKYTPKAIGKNNFDWLICSNATEDRVLKKINDFSKSFNIPIYTQKWQDFPLDLNIIPKTNNIEDSPGIPSQRQGSFWKMCPLRMRLKSYEIVCDNDIVLLKPIEQIFQFLSSNRTLLIKEDAHSVGKYFHLFQQEERFNSGLFGLPPHYDFESELVNLWKCTGRYQPLLSRDEQGLITATLKSNNPFIISENDIVHLMPNGRCDFCEFDFIDEKGITSRTIKHMNFCNHSMSSSEFGYHFLNCNQEIFHKPWHIYKRRSII